MNEIDMATNLFYCNICNFTSVTKKSLSRHIVRRHRFSAFFQARCLYCDFSTRSFSSMKSHLTRQHHRLNKHLEFKGNDEEDDTVETSVNNQANTDWNVQCGEFALNLMTKHRLPQNAVDDILSGTANLINSANKSNQSDGVKVLSDNLYELRTHKRRMKYFRQKWGYIPIRKIYLGSEYVCDKGSCTLKRIPNYGYICPVKETLKKYLNQQDVFDEICRDHTSTSGMMEDFCDGSYVRNSRYIQSHQKCLQIVFYADGISLTNPIGSHRSHHIEAYYFSVVNVRPFLRTNNRNIHVYGICRTKYIKKYGVDNMLQDFVNTMMELYDGIQMTICGAKHKIYGLVLAILGDSPSSSFLAGVKQGSVRARRICRSCNISSEQLQQRIRLSDLEARSHDLHMQRCNDLEQMTGAARKRFGRIWGINSSSTFLKLKYLKLSVSFPKDIMHSLHHNALSFATALILQRAVEKKWMSLEYLNSKLASFPFNYLDVDHKPEAIQRKHIFQDVKLKMTARSLMLISQIMPFLLFERFPENDAHYRNYLYLIAYSTLCCSPFITVDTCGEMQQYAEAYLSSFKRLYPTIPIRPSQHDLLHIVQEAIWFGPPKVAWCYPYERKNYLMKKFQKNNFKNPPLSVMRQNQLECCYNSTSQNYLSHTEEVKEGRHVSFFSIHPELRQQFINATGSQDDQVYATESLTMHTLKYKTGVCLLKEWPNNWPHFCHIEELYVRDEMYIAVVTDLITQEYKWRVNAYTVTNSADMRNVIVLNDMINAWPTPAYVISGDTYIVNRHAHFGGGFF